MQRDDPAYPDAGRIWNEAMDDSSQGRAMASFFPRKEADRVGNSHNGCRTKEKKRWTDKNARPPISSPSYSSPPPL